VPASAADAAQPTTGELSLVPIPDEPDEPVEAEHVGEDDEVGGWAPLAEPAGAAAPSVMAALADEDDADAGEPEPEAEVPQAREAPEPVAAEVDRVAEPEPVAAAEPEAEPEPEPEPVADVADAETGTIPRRRIFGRRRHGASGVEPDPDSPKHVRVLPPRETAVAEAELPPWERGFDDTEERRP
jgi:hypothetical protein